jgi:hypothetical protein
MLALNKPPNNVGRSKISSYYRHTRSKLVPGTVRARTGENAMSMRGARLRGPKGRNGPACPVPIPVCSRGEGGCLGRALLFEVFRKRHYCPWGDGPWEAGPVVQRGRGRPPYSNRLSCISDGAPVRRSVFPSLGSFRNFGAATSRPAPPNNSSASESPHPDNREPAPAPNADPARNRPLA